jgi:hypothetical protein
VDHEQEHEEEQVSLRGVAFVIVACRAVLDQSHEQFDDSLEPFLSGANLVSR